MSSILFLYSRQWMEFSINIHATSTFLLANSASVTLGYSSENNLRIGGWCSLVPMPRISGICRYV